MSKQVIQLGFLAGCLVWLMGCYKQHPQESAIIDPIAAAREYVESYLQLKANSPAVGTGSPFTAGNRQLDWEHAVANKPGGLNSVWVPVHYPVIKYIGISLDKHRLFNTDYLQRLRVWQDSSTVFHTELVSYFPDSNYFYGQSSFSGIVLVRDWQDHFLREYKLESNGGIKKMAPHSLSGRSVKEASNLMMIQLCYYSAGYNESEGYEAYYWDIDLGCEVYDLEQGGHATGYDEAGQYWDSGEGSGGTTTDPPAIPNLTIVGGNNIIGDIRDYTKCFDNIAGYGQHYSVSLCVAQPVPGTREPWGFTRTMPGGSADLVSAGHTFLILSQWDMLGRITRNVGFYPKTGASPISPLDQGQLADDEEHEYNISLTVEMNNSQFFTLLDFISHGNDPGYNYDLNSNNCSSFAIRALRNAGINLPFTVGSWPGGGGFNPGDLGEDIRSMSLPTGMTKSIEQVNHPNWGICY